MVIDKHSYAYISTAATTQVVTGACTLRKIIIGTLAAGSIKIIDDVTGTTTNVAEIEASASSKVYTFDIALAKGLRIVTAAATLITVVFDRN